MNKIKRVKNENFTIISNVFLKDKNLSIKAKGFLAVVMGLPSDWEFSINGVCTILKEGKTAIYNVIDELKENGYCSVVVCRDDKGRMAGNDYTFYEEPQTKKQQKDNPRMENPNMDNQPQLSTNSINNLFDKEEERDKFLSKKEQKDELFEQCWVAYKRKGLKAKSKIQWAKLTKEEKDKVMPHIKAYVSSRDLQYLKDFERYLRDKFFNTLVITNNNVIYDPTMYESNEYRPTLTSQLLFHNKLKCYLYIGFFNGFIGDGYDDNNRPDGAEIMLNNGRGTIIWNKAQKQWILKK